ncbi:MAG: ABC transporter permease [Bdellovibrionaceae bacterium]|nr:ABC transporter permease [Pseudobdellovibrionaceae bacterium]
MIAGFRAIVDDVGGGLLFLGQMFSTALHYRPKSHVVFDQIWKVTLNSLSTTALAGFFVGAIMTVQFTLQVKEFGALGYLGGLATSGTIREVGPLLIAFMLSGKVGAFTSAELGTMRVTEQIDAVRCLGANPFQEIILPRYIAIILSSFFLLAVGLFMSIAGGLLLGVVFSGITAEEYLRHIPTIVTLPSIVSGLFKCLVFALVLASICTYKGFTTTGGAKGVGRAVVATAVATMVGLVIADFVTTLIAEAILSMAMQA